ncbi:hypothetical protein [Gemelliphila palaticanis]|uniref:Inner membrane protein n=1 Tax=Gemelliphila palaticanis TaxID=81950 RepID=A0ABX2SZL3_9BACL|nr:hypothetical protein [Gemella palaticanis]MBF0715892.1 hypothetical protein [Gemella palaticanis]NYS47822.1 hypothetical protein [Gemella palaticanis]
MPTNLFLDILLSLVIAIIVFNVYKQKRQNYMKILSIILVIVHLITLYSDYFSYNETLKIASNTIRFIITMFLTFKVYKKQ